MYKRMDSGRLAVCGQAGCAAGRWRRVAVGLAVALTVGLVVLATVHLSSGEEVSLIDQGKTDYMYISYMFCLFVSFSLSLSLFIIGPSLPVCLSLPVCRAVCVCLCASVCMFFYQGGPNVVFSELKGILPFRVW